jgi:HD-like signal output (HDOD) protein
MVPRIDGGDGNHMMPANRYELSYLLGRVNLPSLPEAVVKLNQSMDNDAALDDIEAIINTDPALAARVLHLANSAWYHKGESVDNIKDAVSNIGFSTIHRLIIITSIIEIFQGIDSTLVNMMTYWKQSVRLACAAKVLAEHAGHDNSLRVFTSGVLAYIGKLVMYIGIPTAEQKVLLVCKDEAIPQYQAEREIIGHDHAEVGSELLLKWHIPEEIARPIKYLYTPEQAPKNYTLDAAVLNIAHNMQYTFWHDIALTDPPAQPNSQAMKILGVTEDMLPSLSRQVDEQYRDTLALLELH